MIFERGHFGHGTLKKSIVNESLSRTRKFSASSAHSTQPTIFLSHKHDDLGDLTGVMELLEEFGVKIYIDSMDKKMPEQTCGETAVRIKEVIKYCDKFVLLATDRAIESYWCNWELGIGDTHKYINNIAIIPMKDVGVLDSEYKGNEYLQIYPSIEYRNGNTKYTDGNLIPKGYYLCKPKDKDGVRIITPLKDWLQRK